MDAAVPSGGWVNRPDELENMSRRDAIFFLEAKDGRVGRNRQGKRVPQWPELPFRGALTIDRREWLVDRDQTITAGDFISGWDFVKNFTIELASI
jgi:hypothetical protein